MSPVTRGVVTGAVAFFTAFVLLLVITAGVGGEALVDAEDPGAGAAVVAYLVIFFAGAAGGAIGAWQTRQGGGGPRQAVRAGVFGPGVVGLLLASASVSAGPVGAILSFVAIVLGAFAGARAAARPRGELA